MEDSLYVLNVASIIIINIARILYYVNTISLVQIIDILSKVFNAFDSLFPKCTV